MKGLWIVFRSELYRALHSRGVLYSALFVMVVPFLRVWAAHLSDVAARLEAANRGREVIGLDSGRGWAPLVEGWRAGLALGALLLLIHGARSLAGDRDSGVLRLAVIRNATRRSLVFGRALLGPLLVLALCVLSGLGSWVAADHWFDFGPLVEDGYTILAREELREELMRAMFSSLPALLGVHAFGLFVSSLARGATGAVASSVAILLAFDLFKESLGDHRFWIFASYAPSFVDSSAMMEMAGVARGYSDAGFPATLARLSHVMVWPQFAALVLLASLVMARRRL